MSKLRIFVSFLVAFLSLAAALTATAADELKIVYNVGVAPLEFEDAVARPAGLFPDLWRLWAKKAGKQIQFVKVDSFKESLQLLKDGKVDLHAGLFKTQEREKFLDYSEPLLALDYYIFTHPSVYPIKSLEKTAGLIVGIQKGGYTEQFVRSKVPANRIAVYDRFQDLVRAALEGEIKVFVATELSLFYYLKENLQINIFEYDQDHPLFFQVYYSATKKGNPALIQKVNEGLKAIGHEERKLLEDRWIVRDFEESPRETVATRSEPEKIALTDVEKSWLAEHKKIRFTGDPDWLPQEAFTSEGQYVGIVADILDLLEARLGILFERIPVKTWDEAVRLAETDGVDMLSETTNSDRDTLTFTEPHLVFPVVIMAQQGTALISDPAELKGKRVAVVKDYGYVVSFRRQFPDLDYVEVDTVGDGLLRLSTGEVDVFLSTTSTASYLMSELGLMNLKFIGSTGISLDLGFGVRKDMPVLVSILNKALASITEEEKLKIRQKWIPAIDTSAPQTAGPISYGRLIGYGIAVFLVLSLVTWILIKVAKKEQLAVSFGSRWFRGLVLAGLSFFVIVVCLLGWYTLDKNKEQILTGIGEDLTETLITADDRLNFWVEKRIASLKLLGRDPELVTLTKRLLAVKPDRESLLASDALRGTRAFFKNNKDVFSNIGFFIINADHVSVGSMRDTNIGTPNLISLQRPELLRRAFVGEVLFVPPMESDVPLGKAPQTGEARNPSTQFFMGPIRGPSGQSIAVMTLRVDPTQDFSQLLPPSTTHRTSEIYAFSERGELLSESRFGDLLRRIGLIGQNQQSALNIAIRDPGVNLVAGQLPQIERSQQPLTRMASSTIQLKADMAKAGQTNGRSKIEIDTQGYRDYRGVPVFGAWLWNFDLGLGLATEIDVAEAMSGYYQIRRTVFGVLGVTLFLSVSAVLLVLILGERTSHALMKARDNLESKVDERTAELQENQKQLEAAVERAGLILDSAGEGIFGVDLDGKVAFINPAANRMLGYVLEELIGEEVHEKSHHSHADGSGYPKEECPMYLTHVDGTDHHVSDEVLWRKDGTPFPVEYTSMPVKKDGRVVGAVVTFMDITERRDMEAQLESTKSQLQYILDTSPIGVAFSTKGKIHFANPRFKEMFGVGVGDSSPDLYVKPEERDALIGQLKAEGKVENYDIQLYNREHQIRDILITYLPMTYDGEEGILGWLLDITDRKKAEKEIKEKYTELSRFRRMAIGREQKMIELKKEINELLEGTGNSGKYKIH
jgi:polar amino acid transport system substrate-binding protein